jgi:hypothetical protein
MIPTFLLICISQVASYSITIEGQTEHGTVAYRTPAHCAAGVLPERQGPPAPPKYEYGQKRQAEAAPAAKAAVAATSEPPTVKPAQKRAKGCKPGRVRDSRGVCRRKR